MQVIDHIQRGLQDYRQQDYPGVLPEAAILMPFTDAPDPELILTVRSQYMPTHAGEVAFPGGRRHLEDADLLATALRESNEEVGLAPDEVRVLGQLSAIPSRFGMKVTPFVGVVRPDVELVAEPGEIASIFRVPWQFFMEEKPQFTPGEISVYGRVLRMPNYYFEGHRIWGLTAFMILDLLNHVFDAGIEYIDHDAYQRNKS